MAPLGTSSPTILSEEERKLVEGSWPLDLLEDPARQARYVKTAHEFLKEVLIGQHYGEVVVLPNGIELLGLEEKDALPKDILNHLEGCERAEQFLRNIRDDDQFLDRYKAGVEFIDDKGDQQQVLKKGRRDLRGRVKEVLRLVDADEADAERLYVAEMRVMKEIPHPVGGDKVKTICLRDVKDVLGPYATWTAYWDRHDEGVFIGGNKAGKGAHIDQVLWSNIGKNWRGYKLVAAWPGGSISHKVVDDFEDRLFGSPLLDSELAMLRQAAKVVLLRPGDVYIFCGGTAHATLCVGDQISLGGYESIASLHPAHIDMLVQSSNKDYPLWIKGAMPVDEFEDILDEVMDQLEDCILQLEEGGVGVDVPSKKVPSEEQRREAARREAADRAGLVPELWRTLRRGLQEDPDVGLALQRQYAQSVDICCCRNKYLAEQMPCEVKACRDRLVKALNLDLDRPGAMEKLLMSLPMPHPPQPRPSEPARPAEPGASSGPAVGAAGRAEACSEAARRCPSRSRSPARLKAPQLTKKRSNKFQDADPTCTSITNGDCSSKSLVGSDQKPLPAQRRPQKQRQQKAPRQADLEADGDCSSGSLSPSRCRSSVSTCDGASV